MVFKSVTDHTPVADLLAHRQALEPASLLETQQSEPADGAHNAEKLRQATSPAACSAVPLHLSSSLRALHVGALTDASTLLNGQWVHTLSHWRKLTGIRRSRLLLSPAMSTFPSTHVRQTSSSSSPSPSPPSGSDVVVLPPAVVNYLDAWGQVSSESLSDVPTEAVCQIERGNRDTVRVTVSGVVAECSAADPLQVLLNLLEEEFEVPVRLSMRAPASSDQQNRRKKRKRKTISPRLPLHQALISGRDLFIGSDGFTLRYSHPHTAVDGWLYSLGMSKYSMCFARSGLLDFFALPFLTKSILSSIDVLDEDAHVMLLSVRRFTTLSSVLFVGEWLHHLGYDHFRESFAKHGVDLHGLLHMTMSRLVECGVDIWNSANEVLLLAMEDYKKFSSVDETFRWLRESSFQKYSFHFARYNIPFYSLPFVNFFLVNEFGVTQDDRMLLAALQTLRNSPEYRLKAVVYWLRDLELERYNLYFARAKVYSLLDLASMDRATVCKLIPLQQDREHFHAGIREMLDFQFYYSAVASLLFELGLQEYSELFATCGITIDTLQRMTDHDLQVLGIRKPFHRRTILEMMAKISHSLPPNATGESSTTLCTVSESTADELQMTNASQSIQPVLSLTSTIRDGAALFGANDLNRKQDTRENLARLIGTPQSPVDANRSVEEWLSFINDDSRPVVVRSAIPTPPTTESKKSSRARAKRARRKLRRREQREQTECETNISSSPDRASVPSPSSMLISPSSSVSPVAVVASTSTTASAVSTTTITTPATSAAASTMSDTASTIACHAASTTTAASAVSTTASTTASDAAVSSSIVPKSPVSTVSTEGTAREGVVVDGIQAGLLPDEASAHREESRASPTPGSSRSPMTLPLSSRPVLIPPTGSAHEWGDSSDCALFSFGAVHVSHSAPTLRADSERRRTEEDQDQDKDQDKDQDQDQDQDQDEAATATGGGDGARTCALSSSSRRCDRPGQQLADAREDDGSQRRRRRASSSRPLQWSAIEDLPRAAVKALASPSSSFDQRPDLLANSLDEEFHKYFAFTEDELSLMLDEDGDGDQDDADPNATLARGGVVDQLGRRLRGQSPGGGDTVSSHAVVSAARGSFSSPHLSFLLPD